jgi:MFS family permease
LTAASTTQPFALDDGGLRRVVATLSITTTVSYGVLYYAFPVLLGSIVVDTGWSDAQATAAFSAGQVVAALCGVGVGHWMDRHGPRGLMTAGSILGVVAVVAIAGAGSYAAFVVGWVVAGVAMSAVFYPPAFAALTHWAGERRVPALTTLTLVAGLASTIFAPLTAALNGSLDWRETYVALAVILGAITIPLHWLGLHGPWRSHPHHEPGQDANPATTGSPLRSRSFVVLAVAFSLASFAVYAALVNLVPLLRERGLTAGEAALALGLGGVGQVAGRLGYRALADSTAVVPRTAIVVGGVAATTLLLAVLPGPVWALMVVSAMVGMLRGLLTLVEATAVSDRWGVAGFGRRNGILSAPVLLAAAVAPFGGAAIAQVLGSQSAAFGVLAGITAAAAILSLATGAQHGRDVSARHPRAAIR